MENLDDLKNSESHDSDSDCIDETESDDESTNNLLKAKKVF